MPLENGVQHDLRCEPRIPAAGKVYLVVDRHDVTGNLLDISSSGFRAAHDCAQLFTGSTVHFEHPGGSGTARVVWNRISDGTVESGFLILA